MNFAEIEGDSNVRRGRLLVPLVGRMDGRMKLKATLGVSNDVVLLDVS